MRHSEKATFVGGDGTSRLDARLDLPSGKPRAHALFAHCFTCGKDVLAASRIAAGLTRHGIAVLRFDFTGLGMSDGEFANTTFSSNVADLDRRRELAARRARRARHPHRPQPRRRGRAGRGRGRPRGGGRLHHRRPRGTGACPPAPAGLGRRDRAGGPRRGAARRPALHHHPAVPGRHRGAPAGGSDQGAGQGAARLPRPPRRGRRHRQRHQIFAAARHPKSFVSLDDADHLLTQREDAIYVADVIAAWAGRYIAPVEAEAVPELTAPAGSVVVAEAGEGEFAQAISVGGRHSLRADEPLDFGGTDSGPSPYDFLLAGLGACTTMTMRMYASRKNLPLVRASVTLRHDKIHAKDCEDCETKVGKIDRIAREITLEGDLDDETRAKLLEIADKCPVHRTLHGEILVETTLKA